MVPHGQPGPWQTSRDSRILRPENFQLTEFGGQPGKLGPAVRGGLDKLEISFRSTGLGRDFASSRDGTDSAAISGVISGGATPVPLHGPPDPQRWTPVSFSGFFWFFAFSGWRAACQRDSISWEALISATAVWVTGGWRVIFFPTVQGGEAARSDRSDSPPLHFWQFPVPPTPVPSPTPVPTTLQFPPQQRGRRIESSDGSGRYG